METESKSNQGSGMYKFSRSDNESGGRWGYNSHLSLGLRQLGALCGKNEVGIPATGAISGEGKNVKKKDGKKEEKKVMGSLVGL